MDENSRDGESEVDYFELDPDFESKEDWLDHVNRNPPDVEAEERLHEAYLRDIAEMVRRSPDGFWLPHDYRSAYHWRQVGETSFEVDGMILYGEITAARLHAIRLTGVRGPGAEPVASEFSSSLPPDQERLLEFGRLLDSVYSTKIYVEWEPRQSGETPDDFYRRVASVHGELSLTNPGDTTSALAELAEVPFSTAVHWVREARKRGFLELSRKQRTIRKGKS